MNFYSSLLLRKILIVVVALKICFGFIYSFSGFVHPHVTRQTDTMGVSLRFAETWRHEAFSLLPRSLAGGEHNAIIAMEFPFLNWITAPVFFLPVEWARIIARIFLDLIIVGFWLLSFRVWRGKKLFGVAVEPALMFLPLLAISGSFFMRFMPDELAFILCLLALGVRSRGLAFALAALGLLIKPPVIVFFALAASEKNWRRFATWFLPAVLVAFVYYTLGMHWLSAHSDLPPYFKTELRSLYGVVEFFTVNPHEFFKFFLHGLFYPAGLILLVLALTVKSNTKIDQRPLWVVLFAQLAGVVVLDGAHSLIHNYYFIGCSLTLALLVAVNLKRLEAKPWAAAILLAPLIGFNFEHMFYETREIFKAPPDSVTAHWQECAKLMSMTPAWPWGQGIRFRSEEGPIPELGLCFGEIQGATHGAYGFYLESQKIPEGCKALKGENEGEVRLVTCQE